MTNDEIERALFHLKAIAGRPENVFSCSFARSILRQSRRKAWTPSPAQWRVMRDLVNQHMSGDLVLIEGDEDA